MIRISDLSDDGALDASALLQFEPSEPIKPDLFLRSGDVILPNRGTRTSAHAYSLQDTNVIVGAQFYILRPNISLILPAYLAWYLRSAEVSQHLALHRRGTLVQTVQRADVESILLPLPPLTQQKTIVHLDSLAQQERNLSHQLAQLRSTLMQRQLIHIAHSF
jgi:restriction endonuclease S subunit